VPTVLLHLSLYGETIRYLAVGVIGNNMVTDIAAIDCAVCCVHTVLFTVVAISLLLLRLMKTSCAKRSNIPSHTSRTVLMLALIAIQVLFLLKDILSTVPRVSSYVASILTAVGTGAGLVYSDIVGSVRPLSVAIVLLLYWFTCTILQLLRAILCFLSEPSLTADVDVCLILDTFMLVFYLSLLVLECSWVIRTVSMHLCNYVLEKTNKREVGKSGSWKWGTVWEVMENENCLGNMVREGGI